MALGIRCRFACSEMHLEVLNVRLEPALLVGATRSGYLCAAGTKLDCVWIPGIQ